MATKEQKRAKLANLTAQVQAQIDEWVGVDIPAMAADIDTLVAVASRNATQNVDLRSLRRDVKIVRFAVRVGRIVLLLAGTARETDVTGSDG
jgi:predicted dinucleotide-utilizing enzyme